MSTDTPVDTSILIHTDAGVMTVTLNRVDRKNSITAAMYGTRADALVQAASSLLVPQMMGYHRAAEALLLGEPFMAEAAMEVGLVNRVLPPTEANGYAQTQARKLAAKPISALIETKRLMKKGQAAVIAQQMDDEAVSFGRMLREPAAREAFTAFMQKRRPDFSGI